MRKLERDINTYITQNNDTWDLIAYKIYGDEFLMTHLLKANDSLNKIAVFPAGVAIIVPKIEKINKEELPPWAI